MEQLFTRWGRDLDPAAPLPEYPRPQLRRDSYLNLNGLWEYHIDDAAPAPICVPYSPEAQLSGAGQVLRPGQCLHYRRTFTLPADFVRERVLLHFGAVDQVCRVFLNGTPLGSHEGGNLAFTFDITDALRPGENELTLDVWDSTEYAPYARGKQKLDKLKGRMSYLFYTPQSGIWKTVWLESVPKTYIRSLRLTPLYDESSLRLDIDAETDGVTCALTILDGGTPVYTASGPASRTLTARLDSFVPWSPEHPHLYDIVLRWGEDEVRSYFGMRKLSVGRDAKGLLRFFLNDKPFFFNGVLDQGYWPEGLLTPPCDDALRYDIEKLRRMGFNTIRKHIKVESDRFYYHCDRLGMLVWQDMPNGGSAYNMVFVTYLPTVFPWLCRHVPDRFYRLFSRADAEGRAQYGRELRGMLEQLYSYPCIAAWTPFNEGWGQFDAAKATALIRAHGGARFINEACGWFDQGGGDMFSIHNYFRRLKVRPQPDRVVALSEYGGYAYEVKGHVCCEKAVGYKSYASPAALLDSLRALWQEQLIPNLPRGLSAAVYTQTSDIEEEINGLMTYDREADKVTESDFRALNEALLRAFEDAVKEA